MFLTQVMPALDFVRCRCAANAMASETTLVCVFPSCGQEDPMACKTSLKSVLVSERE